MLYVQSKGSAKYLKAGLLLVFLVAWAGLSAQQKKNRDSPEDLFYKGLEEVAATKLNVTDNLTVTHYRPKRKQAETYQYDLYRVEEQYDVINSKRTLVSRKVSVGSHLLLTVNQGYNEDDIMELFSNDIIGTPRRIGNTETYIVPVKSPSIDLIGQLTTISTTSQKKRQYDRMTRYLEYDYVGFVDFMPNDPSFDEQWGMHNTGQNGGTADADIDAVEAWDITTGNSSIVIGVIDTGIDYQHPDLSANSWTNQAELNGTAGVDDDGNGYIDDIKGWNFYSNNNNPLDDHGHGTHVAGIIGAIGNNAFGVAGVAWQVQIVAIKWIGASGSGTASGAIGAVDYSNSIPNIVLTNNSWRLSGSTQALKDEIDEALSKDILFIAAAGNSGLDNDISPTYPASISSDNIISVAATDRNDQLASFSNYGLTTVDLGAPGVSIYSTFPGATFASFNGTSMAAPHVAGACVLVKSINPSYNYSQIKSKILDRGDKIPALDGKVLTGKRLNVNQSIQIIPPTDMPIGGIISFFGNESLLPENWVVCNGQTIADSSSPLNGQTVPDLRGRFLRGPDAVYPPNSSGGIDGIPSHSHYFSDVDNNVWFPRNSGNGWTALQMVSRAQHLSRTQYGLYKLKDDDNPFDSHGHMNGVADINGFTLEAGGHDNKPRFYSLFYIMKIK